MRTAKRVLARAAATSILAAASTVTSTPPASAHTGETYRVMTYNIQALPPSAGSGDLSQVYGMDQENRARLIADRILAEDYDIITLNEAFDEDVRRVLLAMLSPAYPHHVDQLLSPGSGVEEDSGLMLFSRFPIRRTGEQNALECVDPAPHAGTHLMDCRAQFHRYEAGDHPDDLAQKGIAHVQVDNPAAGRPLDVFFTHTQSDNRGDEPTNTATRSDQFDEMAAFTTRYSDPHHDAVLMGDLNVPAETQPSATPSAEYLRTVEGRLRPLGFVDSRTFTAPEDHQYSVSTRNSVLAGGAPPDPARDNRLDYILFRQAKNAEVPSCFQHAWLQRQMFYQGDSPFTIGGPWVSTDLSDHYGVSAVVGKDAAQCSPARAAVGLDTGTHRRTIQHDHGYQWYRFEPGTYDFSAHSKNGVHSGFHVQAFAADDLSTPLTAAEGAEYLDKPAKRVVYAPNRPFYVRVSADPGWTGAYDLTLHRHMGATKDDAVVLDPFEVRADERQMSPFVTAPMTKVWYMYRQHPLLSGQKQKLTFTTGSQSLGLKLRIQALDASGNAFSPALQSAAGYSGTTLSVDPATSPILGDAQRLYFTVEREGPALGTYSITRTSDYRQARFQQFYISVQNDHLGHDEPHLYTSVDGGSERHDFLSKMSEKQTKEAPAWMREIGFNHEIRARVIEEDDGLNGGDDAVGSSIVRANADGSQVDDYMAFTRDGEYYLFYRVTGRLDD
ncbi:endonuclease/exonuclease/phosphatase family protein [Kitasatospora sp. NPDC085879]|uniref:endonuclease/exonuclease/phosphatase family protein n=1 Tax=Kitasatospora sp. NPDC085879 TaxID=3154769 RepID=UPI00343FBC3C